MVQGENSTLPPHFDVILGIRLDPKFLIITTPCACAIDTAGNM